MQSKRRWQTYCKKQEKTLKFKEELINILKTLEHLKKKYQRAEKGILKWNMWFLTIDSLEAGSNRAVEILLQVRGKNKMNITDKNTRNTNNRFYVEYKFRVRGQREQIKRAQGIYLTFIEHLLCATCLASWNWFKNLYTTSMWKGLLILYSFTDNWSAYQAK